MAKVQAEHVKDLRERTGAGLLDCKKALLECDGNVDQAIEYLRKKGLSAAAKKAGRIATEGLISSYIHMNQRIGVLLEVNCETDFVANTDDFKQLCADISMQIAALSPDCVRREEISQETMEAERRVLREKALEEGKSAQIVDKIVDGQINKFYSDRVLLEQKFVKDDKKTIEQLVKESIAKLGENIQIRRFVRYELGEGLEKKKEDFAAEVAAAQRQ